MPRRDLVVIAASAGGLDPLRTLMAGLPPEFPAAVAVVLHVSPYGGSALPAILTRAGPLPAEHARHGQRIRPGHVYVAPPDFHLVVHDGQLGLSRGPRENGHRPAADVLFRTAARTFGTRVVGVVLSGALDDGTAGLAAIREHGGVTVVQAPAEAMYRAMPENALAHVPVEHVLPVKKMAEVLLRLTGEEVPSTAPAPPELLQPEAAVAGFEQRPAGGPEPVGNPAGNPAGFSCPDCNGVLSEIRDSDLVRYRCRVGHAWSPESLLAQQSLALEGALWMALRSLEEKAELSRQLADQAGARGSTLSAERFGSAADEAATAAALVRRTLESGAGFEPGGTDGA